MTPSRPPRLAERVLSWCLRRHPAATCIVGDLRQEYAELRRRSGAWRASAWYWSQVSSIGVRYIGRDPESQRGRPAAVAGRRSLLSDVLADALMTFRTIRKAPGFSLAVVATLALGIGANATMFGVVDRVLLSPPDHVRDHQDLRILHLSGLGQRSVNSPLAYSFPDFAALDGLPVLAGQALYRPPRGVTMSSGPDAGRAIVQDATASFFGLLGVVPFMGRFFDSTDDAIGARPVAVLSHDFWDREFGRAEGVAGRSVQLGSTAYEVIGVAPPGFTGAELSRVDVWVPVRMNVSLQNSWQVLESRGAWWFRVIIRLADGVSNEEAESLMTAAHSAAVTAALENGDRNSEDSMGARVHAGSFITALGPNATTSSSITLWLAGVSLLVLLIACANVANLLMARGVQLQRDRAVRLAFGVSRRRLITQSLTEALVFAGLGGLAAALVARWSGRAIYSVLLFNVPLPSGGPDLRLVAFLGLALTVTTVLSGVLPAIQALGTAPGDVLRSSRRGSTRAGSRVRAWLTTGQVMLSVVLLVGAGLFLKSLSHASQANLGFDHESLIVVEFERVAGVNADRRDELYREALPLLRTLPGVESAVVSSSTRPLYGWDEQHEMRASRIDTIPRVARGGPYTYSGTEGFVETVGLRMFRGRAFEAADYRTGGPPQVMVSRSFAEGVWPGLDPLNECVYLEQGAVELDGPEPCRPVVGVYEDLAVRGLSDGDRYSVTWPHPLEADGLRGLLVRSAVDATGLVGPIRELLAPISSDIRYVHVTPIGARVDAMLGPWRVGAIVFTVFGVLALVVASLGLYSVLAFSVAHRRREIGIRAALGAQRGDLVRMVVAQAGKLVLVGLAMGGAAALAAGGMMDSVLYGVPATDVGVFATVGLTLLLAGILAAWIPAWNATAMDPAAAIQAD